MTPRGALKVLGRAFFARPSLAVARDLVGKVLVRRAGGRTLSGRIVETEAYTSDDPASHAFRGMTERNRALFGQVGRAYVYQTHGSNFCLNVVARKGRRAGGVLVRALEPLEGIESMRRRRRGGDPRRPARGPGNLARALGIDRRLYGTDLTRPGPLFIVDDGAPPPKVRRTVRIGVTAGRDLKRRFVADGSRHITRPRLG